jgi:alkaline phosphatase D
MPRARSSRQFVPALCAVLALFLCALPASARLVVMHGYADYTSALIWVQAEAAGPIDIGWHVDGDATLHNLRVDAKAEDDFVVSARLTGLTPGARVAYVVAGDGDRREGALRAQPYWTRNADAPDISIAIGSCYFLADPDPRWGGQSYGGGFEIFDSIAGKNPDLMIWMGDNLYFQAQDELDPSAMAARYRRQRAHRPLQKLLTAAPQIAIWDDHDYGPNDADLSYTMKGTSLALFKRYWANPSFGLPEVPGVFGRARFGDVDIFLLDDRYYRSANLLKDDLPDKTMFGAAQMAWLKSALVYSKAPIKLIVNGSQMWNRTNRFEGFNHFEAEQKAFTDFLASQRIEGVIFLTGDRHFSQILKIDRPNAYSFYEFTSSPLTSGPWENPPAEEIANPDVVPGTLVPKRQFGMLRIRGPGNDRRIALEGYDQKGELLFRHEIRARDLRFAKP